MNNGDNYKRIPISDWEYQCGCRWARQSLNGGDVLVECVFHKQVTVASVNAFERDRAASLARKEG